MGIPMTLRALQVEWLNDPNVPSVSGLRRASNQNGKPILAVKHSPNGKIFLTIDLLEDAIANPKVTQIELIHNAEDGSTQKSISVPFTLSSPTLPTAATFDMTQVLTALNTAVNTNIIEAKVTISGGGQSLTASSVNLVHLMSQKVVLFIPGVAGSEITVQQFPKELSFPAWSVGFPFTVNEFERLNCDRNGVPIAGGQSIKVGLLEKFAAIKITDPLTVNVSVYNVRNRNDMQQPSQHPLLLKRDGTALLHYQVIAWPYDWRLRLETAVEFLLGNTPFGPSVGAPLPSISKVLSDQKASMPLLDDKIAMAGHSTGGVILRGLMSRPEAANLVSKCFFMNVPFFGAPKAYFVYLTGDFLPFIANDLLQRMAPNLPIVYYLAPTEKYADDVALLTSGNVKRSPGQNVGNTVVKPLVFLMQGNYPSTLPRWNDGLEASARAYHAAITTPVIGWNNCLVFFSKQASPDTPGAVFPTGVTLVDHTKIDGDGTVPLSSLKGDSDPKRQIEIPGGPDHTSAPNQAFVWSNVAAELSRDR